MLRFIRSYCKILVLQWLLLASSLFTFSQFKVRLQVADIPANHSPDSFFVAGSFNNWNPRKNGGFLSGNKDSGFIELPNLPAGDYQFKFTRGSWQAVECNAGGNDIGNRLLSLSSDTTINVSIKAWKDEFETVVKPHTLSANVHIIDTAFEIPQLSRNRRIWVYLPPGYSHSKKHYPVMYLQDGQNIFDSYTAAFGEWGVDETADSLVKAGKPACIIVAIDNGPQRLTEYNPFDNKNFGKGEGDRYLDFIVKNLKPFIDKKYRTLPNNENTIIAGSSMGGLISYYALLKYPEVFGKGGIFSPAFWVGDKIKDLTDSLGSRIKGTVFFYMGEKEGDRFLDDMKTVTEKLGNNSIALIYVITDPESGHNEQAWRKWFPEFYNWVLAKGFNNIIKL